MSSFKTIECKNRSYWMEWDDLLINNIVCKNDRIKKSKVDDNHLI